MGADPSVALCPPRVPTYLHGMTDPHETSENIQTLSNSDGEPDQIRKPSREGSDVGGPAQTMTSSTEDALTGTSTVGAEDGPDDEAKNPL